MIIATLFNPHLNFSTRLTRLMPSRPTPLVAHDDQQLEPRSAQPDIYYIILDGYPGNGVLTHVFHYDNTPFLTTLQQQGFYTAGQSTSNYSSTFLSIASSLNYTYLRDVRHKDQIRPVYYAMIKDSRIVRTLKAKGYRIINFASGYGPTEWLTLADTTINCNQINEFYTVFGKTTLLGLFDKEVLVSKAAKQKQCTFKRLADIASTPGPKFVFAHIVCPHPPYLFDRHGAIVSENTNGGGDNPVWHQKQAFVGQLIFLNHTMTHITQRILKQSAHPPIILIQGDHGSAATFNRKNDWQHPSTPMMNERMHILNTYYIPKRYGMKLYPTITPVNSFRLILTTLYGEPLPLLPDRNYFSAYASTNPGYVANDVTTRIKPY